jgi:hypothetical protein
MIFGFLSLVYCTQHDDPQFHPFSCKWHNFILLYGLIKLHFVYIHHFLYPLIGVGDLCWFHSLAIVYTAATSIGVQVFLWFINLCSFGYLPRVVWGHQGGLVLVFWWSSMLVSIVVALAYIPTSSVWGSFFPASSPALFFCSGLLLLFRGLTCFYMNFRNDFSILWIMTLGFWLRLLLVV